MKIRVPSYYKEFKCIASDCEDTCCAGWDVVIDSQTSEIYQNMEGALGEKSRSKMMVDEEGDTIFVLDGDRCPFLNTSNFCDIHKEKGEQYLCHTCKLYPRYIEEFFDLKEMGISLSCPEAARIILRNTEPTEFELSEEPTDGGKSEVDHEGILEEFFQCRDTVIGIIEMEDLSLGLRASMVLRFVEELQDKVDFAELDKLKQVREQYNKNNYLKELKKELCTNKGEESVNYDDVYKYIKTYMDLEHINEKDPLSLNNLRRTFWENESGKGLYINKHKAFNHYYREKMIQFDKVLLYFIYRYFMKSFYDYDMSSKIKLAVMSVIMIKELAVVRWMENGKFCDADMVDICHIYSKDIEHLVENIETLETIFETEEVYGVDRIINTLMYEF